jgi:site-specific recombinase XerD
VHPQKEELDVFEVGKRSFYDFAAKTAENKKPATQREYRYTLNELKKAVPTLERIHQITPQTFADFKTYLQANGLKVNAIAKRLAIFSAIGKQAVKAGLLSSGVLLKFERVKQ